jgi:hypothetical protein
MAGQLAMYPTGATMSTGTILGKGIEGHLRRQNPVTMDTKRADLEKIKAFIAENTCFKVAFAHLSQDESRITLRTKLK